ncbi:RagB/SusD family nutrient uptake outer membrane protein [Dyadobacter sandarakinus]|uniref:RagB/SusD family nutrient uptake outer membrane protein n=1 Tax=Dyadobacter sandarakinus TaxID=2747268 RepID=A0ABX7I662_9BACT|nr:RagB/SusD family nutrient uptake outer membrane protein [Dyadobacter sandarakinus]QRR01213.1 RagB/SusD family nutrient uptake outer membrane protein [Dyadobacter sandarakinus]
MKLTYMTRTLKYIGLAVLLLSGQACKDILDEDVISSISDDYMNSAAGFNSAVNAAYSSLRSYYGTERGLSMTEFGTDLYTTGADGSFKGFHLYDSQLIGTVSIIQELWEETYKGINTCNAVIDRAPGITGVADAVKAQRVAEMKFLRALYYFNLMQQFGGVDLRLSETVSATKATTRASEDQMYAAIIADLEAALPVLENKAKSADYGRATKAAAEHLLARVYLTKATSTAKAADDYVKAATYAQNVVTNYGFRLLPDFASVFAQGAGEINDEVVFSVQYTADALTNGTGNTLHLYFGMQYDVQAGMQRDITYDRPFKRLRPTTYTLETVFKDRVNDSRYQKTFRSTWLCNTAGGTFTNVFDNSKASVTFKPGDTTIYIPGVEWTLAQRAAKPYQVLVPSLYNNSLFPTLIKFMDPMRPDKTWEPGSRDYLAFRLADTYLILAEALLSQGKTVEAAAAINMVRRRAAFPGKETAMEIKPADLTMEVLMEERGRELLGEQTRWLDLKRWGVLVDRVKKYNPDGAANIKPTHVLRPIPQTQIDRSDKASDGSAGFPQNPGY